MTEYIDRETYITIVKDIPMWGNVAAMIAGSVPAADVAPVKHGRWVSVPYKLARVCSVCNRDEPYKFADIDADVYDYCPNCGARMDLEE